MFLVEALEDSISVQGRPNPSLQIRDGHSNCWLALAKLSESAVSYVGGEKHEKLKTTRKRRRSDDDDDDAETERKARQAGMGEEHRRKEGRKTNSAQNDRRTTIPREIVTSNASVTGGVGSRKKKYRPFGQAGSSGHPAGPYLGLRVSIPLISKLGRFPRKEFNFNFNF